MQEISYTLIITARNPLPLHTVASKVGQDVRTQPQQQQAEQDTLIVSVSYLILPTPPLLLGQPSGSSEYAHVRQCQ